MMRGWKTGLGALAAGTALAVGAAVTIPAVGAETAVAPAGTLQAAPGDQAITSVVNGTWTGRNGKSGTVTGTFTPEKFGQNGKSLTVRGVLDLVLTRADGTVERELSRRVVQPVSLAPAGAQGSAMPSSLESASTLGLGDSAVVTPATVPVPEGCDVLNLVLGPLDLNLLGLVIVLQQVQLDIVAVPGAGALLGNLLCAVAGLLDGGFSLGLIADLLNAILAIIEGLGGGVGGLSGASAARTLNIA
jgi:hypothetical protein